MSDANFVEACRLWAEKVERLEAELAALRSDLAQAIRDRDEVDAHRNRLYLAQESWLEMKAERDALRAQVERYKAALESIAESFRWRTITALQDTAREALAPSAEGK